MLTVCVGDEPEDGPDHYVVITGFYEPHLLTYLDEIGIAVDCVIQLESRVTSSQMLTAGSFSFFDDFFLYE